MISFNASTSAFRERSQVNLKHFNLRFVRMPFAFWIAGTVLAFLANAVGVSAEFVIISGMVAMALFNLSSDRTGVNNLLHLIVLGMIGIYPIRMQLGFGFVNSTTTFNSVLYILLILIIGLEFVRSPQKITSKIFLAVTGYLFVILAVVVASSEPFGSVRRHLFSTTFTYLMFLLAYLVARRNSFRIVLLQVLFTLMCCGLADGIYGLIQYVSGLPEYELRAFELLGTEEYVVITPEFIKIIGLSGSAYGLFYNLVFFVLALLYIRHYVGRKLQWLLTSTVIVSILLLLTFTERTAVVMLLIASGSSLLVIASRGRLRRLFGLFLLGAGCVALLFPIVAGFLEVFFPGETMKLERMQELARPSEAATILWRYRVWEEGYNQISNSLVFGDGLKGGFAYHMEYLNVLVSFGILGFSFWVVFLGGLLRKLWRIAYSASVDPLAGRMAIALIGFFISLAAAAIPNNPFTYSSGLVLFTVGGILIAGRDSQAQA